jgi:regulator of sirC expression with transglutaminase-like and TPR domain
VGSDDHFPLLEAAASLAQDEYPELDVQQVLGDVDQLAGPPEAPPAGRRRAAARLRALNQFFFRDLNFGGNVNDYCDPDNSYLNAVLRTRRGIRSRWRCCGSNWRRAWACRRAASAFRATSCSRSTLPKGQVVIDPFTGKSLSREELGERLEPYKRSSGLVGDFDVPLGLYLQRRRRARSLRACCAT